MSSNYGNAKSDGSKSRQGERKPARMTLNHGIRDSNYKRHVTSSWAFALSMSNHVPIRGWEQSNLIFITVVFLPCHLCANSLGVSIVHCIPHRLHS